MERKRRESRRTFTVFQSMPHQPRKQIKGLHELLPIRPSPEMDTFVQNRAQFGGEKCVKMVLTCHRGGKSVEKMRERLLVVVGYEERPRG